MRFAIVLALPMMTLFRSSEAGEFVGLGRCPRNLEAVDALDTAQVRDELN